MIETDLQFPKQRQAPFRDWSPSIHYAQYQRMPKGPLAERRIYDFELLYVCQGEAVTIMQGKEYKLTTGQLIFLPSGVWHRNEVLTEPDARFLGIHFDFFDELDIQRESDIISDGDEVEWERFATEAVCDSFPPLSHQPVYTPTLDCVQLMDQLVHEFTMRPLGYELACKAIMLNILTHLLRLPVSRARSYSSQHAQKLKEIIEQIEQHPSTPWSNKMIADQMKLSIDHTAKLFKEIAGLPPNEFIHTIRHREARRLLRETDMSIERIGEQVGYSGIHYFSRLFRRHEGISATEYRKLSKVL
ncbi:helix-turn-helix transcriptional regulator [Paenibacillus chungangensis]|uniref:AraC family transcriptional regulator n=1 Tax=Paenibacillus chungangensis TaxID=696535 RepID=A0ABW3HSN6_9BACL